MPLIHLIYASAATADLSAAQLGALLAVARGNNTSAAVTGMLLYSEGSFFQVLEGAPGAVDATFARITTDPRHRRATVIIRESIARRAFGEWSMGCATPSGAEVAAAAGMNDFFDAGSCFDRLDGGRARKLLAAFRDGRWHTAARASA